MAEQEAKRTVQKAPGNGLPKIVGLVDTDDESEKAEMLPQGVSGAPVTSGGVAQVRNMYVDGDSPYGWLALKEKHRPSSKRTVMYLRPIIVQEPVEDPAAARR